MVQCEIMFAQATLNEIQRSGDTITLSSLPSQVGWVYPASESQSTEAPEERAPLETDYMSVDKRIGLHFTSASDKPVIIFWFLFFHALARHVMHPGQDACLAA